MAPVWVVAASRRARAWQPGCEDEEAGCVGGILSIAPEERMRRAITSHTEVVTAPGRAQSTGLDATAPPDPWAAVRPGATQDSPNSPAGRRPQEAAPPRPPILFQFCYGTWPLIGSLSVSHLTIQSRPCELAACCGGGSSQVPPSWSSIHTGAALISASRKRLSMSTSGVWPPATPAPLLWPSLAGCPVMNPP